MADPVFSLISGGAQALGSILDGNARSGEYATQAAMESANARNLDTQAQQIGSAGARDEESQRRRYRRTAGSQFAALAESGLGTDGSAADAIRRSETEAEIDALNIRADATNRAQEARYGAAQARARSSLAKQMSKRARWAGVLGAAGAGFGAYGEFKARGG